MRTEQLVLPAFLAAVRDERRVAHRPVQLNMGMGVDSAALLTRWLLDPVSRDFDLTDLTVVTAMTGDEYAATERVMKDHLLPLMRAHGVRYVQIGRAGQSDEDGYIVLDDSHRPGRMLMRGPWRLSDELRAAGTLPTASGARKCSARAKGLPLDQFAEAEYSGPYRCAVGFAAEEPGRAVRDTAASAVGRHAFYPLIEWGWDRERCADYLRAVYGVEWPRSCCVYCPFAGGSRAKNELVAERWSAEPDAAADVLVLEYVSLALNPKMALFKDVAAHDVAKDHQLAEVMRLGNERLRSVPWSVYEVRRVIRRKGDTTDPATGWVVLGPDGNLKGQPWRSVRQLDTGTADDMIRAVAAGPGRTVRDGRHLRSQLLRPRASYPTAEKFLVAAPTGVEDKHRKNFERLWVSTVNHQARS